ncbi:unnamed protein product [Pichia kudriavzevii]
MNQLLDKIKGVTNEVPHNTAEQAAQPLSQSVENEEDILRDVKTDTFKKVTERVVAQDENDGLTPLKPNLTGSASKSMREHFMQQFEKTFNYNSTNGSFNAPYTDISSLSAQSQDPPAMSNTLAALTANQNSSNPTSLTEKNSPVQFPHTLNAASPNIQNLFSGQPNNPSPQIQYTNPQNNTTLADFSQEKQQADYFGMISHNNHSVGLQFMGDINGNRGSVSNANNNISSNNDTNNNTKNDSNKNTNFVTLPQPPTITRSRASSTASPPPIPPPPPRSRKSSRASAAMSNIPPPSAAATSPSLASNMNPALPPKPMLNDTQRKQYLSVTDEVSRPFNSTSPLGNCAHLNQYGNTVALSSVNLMQDNSPSPLNGMGIQNLQINGLSDANTQNGTGNQQLQTARLNGSNQGYPQYHGNVGSGVYQMNGAIPVRNASFNTQNIFMNQATGGGWAPSQYLTTTNPQQHQQQQQQQQRPQNTGNWSGWQI